jgi:hypothetical protein
VPVREHETIAVSPLRIRGIVFDVITPQDFRDIGHAHRGAGMTRVGSLHGVHAQGSDRIRKIAPGGMAGVGSLL